jgi:hypothetical protein
MGVGKSVINEINFEISAEFAKENLAKEIDTCLKLNKAKNYKDENEYITASIKEGFDIVVRVN